MADGVMALTLARADGADLPEWTPGAHIDLVLGDDLVRQYSLCGRTGETGAWRIAVLEAPDSRGGSVQVHELDSGPDPVRCRGPRNHFPVVARARYLFIAGGIGDHAAAPDDRRGGGRRRRLGAALRRPQPRLDGVRRRPGAGTATGCAWCPRTSAGRLDLAAVLGVPRPGTLVYACGPEGLLAAVEQRCAAWPPGSLHLERFAARLAPRRPPTESSFEIVLQHSGRTLTVPPDRSVFDTVRQAGVSVLGSCLEGICGTCETEVLDGDVDHRDSVLDDERTGGRRSDDDLRLPLPGPHA